MTFSPFLYIPSHALTAVILQGPNVVSGLASQATSQACRHSPHHSTLPPSVSFGQPQGQLEHISVCPQKAGCCPAQKAGGCKCQEQDVWHVVDPFFNNSFFPGKKGDETRHFHAINSQK